MYSKILPTEIILQIYEYCDVETRIKLNSLMKWNYYDVHPYSVKIFDTIRPPQYRIREDGQIYINIIMCVKLPIKNTPIKWC